MFGNVEKNFKVILCLGPNLKLFSKFVKISRLRKWNDPKIPKLRVNLFFHVITGFYISKLICERWTFGKILVLETYIKKGFKTEVRKWSNHKRNTREGLWSWWSNATTSSKVTYQNTIWSHVFNTIWNNISITHIP